MENANENSIALIYGKFSKEFEELHVFLWQMSYFSANQHCTSYSINWNWAVLF